MSFESLQTKRNPMLANSSNNISEYLTPHSNAMQSCGSGVRERERERERGMDGIGVCVH